MGRLRQQRAAHSCVWVMPAQVLIPVSVVVSVAHEVYLMGRACQEEALRVKRQHRWTSRGVLTLLVLALGLLFARIKPTESWEEAIVIPVGTMNPGTVQLLRGVWVARQPDGPFSVFLNQDPHNGHPTDWDQGKGLFITQANGATYRIDGTCNSGPCDSRPGSGLYVMKSKVEGDRLLVLPKVIISGGHRPRSSLWNDLNDFFRIRKPAAPQQPRG